MNSANCKLKNDQRGHRRDRCHSAFCLLPSAFSRRAFTLVELLVTITILAILASLILAAMAGASSMAREAKTKGTVTKLHALVMAKYESYLTRRVPITIPNSMLITPTGRRQAAQYRLAALRELMRMEMPERYTDIPIPSSNTNMPVTHTIAGDAASPLMPIPAVASAYRRALVSTQTIQFQGAECLYLLISLGLDDPDVMEQFSSGEIGDYDQDGMPEFWDGWGYPISFLRWAPAYTSPLQATSPTERDPFDPFNVEPYPPSFPLYPLIFSAGPDKLFDIVTKKTQSNGSEFSYATVSGANAQNDPFYDGSGDGPRNFFGKPNDDDNDGSIDSIDNITNHDIEAR